MDKHPQFTVYVNGSFAPAADGEIEFFDVGTTGDANRRYTYNVPNPSDPVDPSEINNNPVPLDGYGRSTVPIFLVGTYNTVIRDSEGNQLDTVDNVEGSGCRWVECHFLLPITVAKIRCLIAFCICINISNNKLVFCSTWLFILNNLTQEL